MIDHYTTGLSNTHSVALQNSIFQLINVTILLCELWGSLGLDVYRDSLPVYLRVFWNVFDHVLQWPFVHLLMWRDMDTLRSHAY